MEIIFNITNSYCDAVLPGSAGVHARICGGRERPRSPDLAAKIQNFGPKCKKTAQKNYFKVTEYYFKATEHYFKATEHYFKAFEIILSHTFRCFFVSTYMFQLPANKTYLWL